MNWVSIKDDLPIGSEEGEFDFTAGNLLLYDGYQFHIGYYSDGKFFTYNISLEDQAENKLVTHWCYIIPVHE